ncbi:MAG: Lycopene beta-cyclase [Pedobacter sp.]|jgi:lycopene beta-cyclase|nr:Lycopene beta-cyclase [Pedobacter sp.]
MVSGYGMEGGLKKSRSCDIIIAGAGLAGFSLLYRAMQAGHWKDLTIIVVDKCTTSDRPTKNWSFWKRSTGPFDHLICKSWNNLSFFTNSGVRKDLDLNGYSYHTIKSQDFYTHCRAYLMGCKNISFIDDEILTITTEDVQCFLDTASHSLTSTYLFNSIYTKPRLEAETQYFLQHFKGLLIKTSQPVLNPEEAYLMDFRTSQEHGTSFFYTLPMAANAVFVEYTIFSKTVIAEREYDEKLSTYLRDVLKVREYEVAEHEYGVIPMTDHIFPRFQGNIINIGSAGGDTRGATGYTFTNMQKTISSILTCWSANGNPFFHSENISLKHKIYDSCLLNVLNSGEYKGNKIFEDLFMRSKASTIFAFLDAESMLLEDVSVIASLKPWAFLKGMTAVLSSRFKSFLR